MLYHSKITRQGQITIPKQIREKHNLQKGDNVTYVDLGDRVEIIFNPKDPLEALKNLNIDETASTEEIKALANQAAQQEVNKRRS